MIKMSFYHFNNKQLLTLLFFKQVLLNKVQN